MSEKTLITLYGETRRKFGKHLPDGRSIKMDVKSPREATRALCSVIPGFRKYMIDSLSRGIVFAVFKGKSNIKEDELDISSGGREIRIAPIVKGNKSAGVFQTIIGVALVVAAGVATFGFGSALLAAGGGLTGWGMVGAAGITMALGGVVQMMTAPKVGLSNNADSDNSASYAFGSPVNTTTQGYPVPVLFGEREVGGGIISAGSYAEDQQ